MEQINLFIKSLKDTIHKIKQDYAILRENQNLTDDKERKSFLAALGNALAALQEFNENTHYRNFKELEPELHKVRSFLSVKDLKMTFERLTELEGELRAILAKAQSGEGIKEMIIGTSSAIGSLEKAVDELPYPVEFRKVA